MTRGEFAIIAATVLVVLAVFLWIAVDKIEGIEPGCIVGGCGVGRGAWGAQVLPSLQDVSKRHQETLSCQPPIPESNRTGRAATTGESSVQSSRPKESGKPAQARLVRLFDALRQVESGGNDYAVGDGGRSKGPYQCGRAAWADGGGNPADYDRLVWNRAACERVMLGYWKRYGAVMDEQKSRTWNGGPRGAQKKATLKYWHTVEEAMR